MEIIDTKVMINKQIVELEYHPKNTYKYQVWVTHNGIKYFYGDALTRSEGYNLFNSTPLFE